MTESPAAAAVRGVIMALNVVAIVAMTIWELWATWVAFFGGTFPWPFTSWVTDGSFVLGLLVMFIGAPLAFGVVRLFMLGVSALLTLLLVAPAAAAHDARERRMATATRVQARPAPARTASVTVKVGAGSIRFERDGAAQRIVARGFGPGGPTPQQVAKAKDAARRHLSNAGRPVWL